MTLTRSQPTAEINNLPSCDNHGSQHPHKILVIEDTEEVREIIRATLEFEGFQILEAEDGYSGTQAARAELPDLILCDINMPQLDGYDTLARLRRESATASIPFVFLTGVADRNNHRRGMESGADDYLTKPFTAGELIAAVNTRLAKQEALKKDTEKQLDELCGNIRIALPHELRTPLNGIVGISSFLQEEYASLSPEEVLENAGHINTAAMRLHRLIENFLVCAQLELYAKNPHQRQNLKNHPNLDIQDILESTPRELARIQKRDPDLHLDLQARHVATPAEHAKKIVEEVVDNAFKFSRPGTPVHVATSRHDGEFCLAVTNHGRGLTPEQINRIGLHRQFERHVYEQQGAGMGLGIVRKMAELVDGRLVIESTPGQETHVRVFLPVH